MSTDSEPRRMAAPSLRAPPNSLEAERGVLGSILLDVGHDNRVLDLCVENGITAEAFTSGQHSLIFETVTEMSRAGVAIDPLTLCDRLKALERLEAIGGAATIQALIDGTPTSAHAEYYIGILRQKFLLRRIIRCSRDAEKQCYDETINADIILGEVEQKFLGIAQNNNASFLSWPQAIGNTMGHIERLFSLGAGAIAGLPTGFLYLDKKLKGLRNGEMIVLAARPSMGKTSLAINIAECVALGRDIYGKPMKGDHNRTHGVVIFSLEMSTESLAMRMLCGYAGVPGFQIDQGMISPKTCHQKLVRSASELSKAPLYVDDSGGLDVMDMRARARRMKKRHNIELVIIDYLQLCNCREFARQGRQIETSQISGQIKAMAKELNVPVVVLSQLSRSPEQRGNSENRPKLSDLRDSGAIEQDADVVLMLRRPCKIPGSEESSDLRLAIVDVAKHRNGPTGEVRMDFDDQLTRFGNRSDQDRDSDDQQPNPNADPMT